MTVDAAFRQRRLFLFLLAFFFCCILFDIEICAIAEISKLFPYRFDFFLTKIDFFKFILILNMIRNKLLKKLFS